MFREVLQCRPAPCSCLCLSLFSMLQTSRQLSSLWLHAAPAVRTLSAVTHLQVRAFCATPADGEVQKLRCIKQTGKKIPVLGLGTWRTEKDDVQKAVEYAILNGYRHVDTAKVYKNHTAVGMGLKNGMTLYNKHQPAPINRESIWLTSKLWNTNHHPDQVKPACQQALSELGVSYLDLYLMHWPVATIENDDGSCREVLNIPLKDTWQAMEQLVSDGLVKHIGVSNFTQRQLADLLPHCRVRPITNQVEFHPYLNQQALQQFCESEDIFITAYSPLGNLTPHKPQAPTPLADPLIIKLAMQYNKTPAQILIRWSIQGGRVCIPKSVRKARLVENSDVFRWSLSQEDMSLIDQLGVTHRRRMLNPTRFNLEQTPFFTD